MDNLGLTDFEDRFERVKLEKRVGIVGNEALFPARSIGKIPRVSGGGGGHSAKKASESSGCSKTGLLEVN